MSLMSLISSNCNRHGARFLCTFTFLVGGAVRRLVLVRAGEIAVASFWSYLFSVDFAAYAIVVAALCIPSFIFFGRTARALAAAALTALCLWWMSGFSYLSFPSVYTRHRAPASFTLAISSFSRRTAPSCGRLIISILSQVVTNLLPPAVVILGFMWWFSDEAVTMRVFKKNLSSVVFISVGKREVGDETLDERIVREGTGSGFVWDKRGHIVTNFHVIRSESNDRSQYKVDVKLSDGCSYDAEIVGWDEKRDVAVLRISEQAKNMRPVHVGASANLRVGQKVYAIGNPFGLDRTLTTGVVSGLHRDLSSPRGVVIEDGIQTDASINHGSSGGPLLDSSGKLIGINTAFYSPNGTSSGVGFSIAIDTVRGIIEQIIANGKVTRPYIGIKFASDQSRQQLGLSGVLVYHVDSNSPAQKSGILPNRIEDGGHERKGDIIVSFNGQIVNNGSDLYNILDKCKAGKKVKVEVLRAGEIKELVVTLRRGQ